MTMQVKSWPSIQRLAIRCCVFPVSYTHLDVYKRQQALNVFKNDADAWRQIQKNGMSQNLSWDKSALEYLAEYQKLLA